jgi:hypothetical protein
MKWHLFRGAEALRHPKAKSKSGEPLYTFQKAEVLGGYRRGNPIREIPVEIVLDLPLRFVILRRSQDIGTVFRWSRRTSARVKATP